MNVYSGARRVRSGKFASRVESELEATIARVVEAHESGVPATDLVRGMRRARGGAKLTAEQRREVRRMLEDGEAYTRAEAVACVLEMGGE